MHSRNDALAHGNTQNMAVTRRETILFCHYFDFDFERLNAIILTA